MVSLGTRGCAKGGRCTKWIDPCCISQRDRVTMRQRSSSLHKHCCAPHRRETCSSPMLATVAAKPPAAFLLQSKLSVIHARQTCSSQHSPVLGPAGWFMKALKREDAPAPAADAILESRLFARKEERRSRKCEAKRARGRLRCNVLHLRVCRCCEGRFEIELDDSQPKFVRERKRCWFAR